MPTETTPEVERILDKLQGVKPDGKGWSARCPCRNDDANPSLRVGVGREGAVVMKCHRGNGCSTEEICQSIGVTMMDLFPKDSQQTKVNKKRVATYRYEDPNGTLLFEKVRYVDDAGRKSFVQRKPDPDNPGKFVYDLSDVPKVLYELPLVLDAVKSGKKVVVVEGEKDADTLNGPKPWETLEKKGFIATTMPGGAGKWLDEHTQTLKGANVVVIADNDSSGIGQDHALHVIEVLKPVAKSVKGMIPPDKVKDVSDLLGMGKQIKDLVDFPRVVPAAAADIQKALDDLIASGADDAKILKKISSITVRESVPTRAWNVKTVDWDQWLKDETDDSYDWVIPGLIERGDRVIVVAAEGIGKSYLARQVAICSSAGIHPFTGRNIDPIRTLTVDLENPERILKRTSRRIMKTAKERRPGNYEIKLTIKPSGLNLLAQSDQDHFEELVAEHKPEIIFTGPLYKSFIDPGNRSAEALATEIAMYFDYIRSEYNCCLWLEQHAPLGESMAGRELRPFGSSVWSRWPEFGLALSQDPTEPGIYKVNYFRGARDEREFPEKMRRGIQQRGEFPFVVEPDWFRHVGH